MLPEAPVATSSVPFLTRKHEAFVQLPQLTDKAIVDLVNGLLVTEDHIGQQAKSQTHARRVLDSLSGDGSRRQHAINATLASQVRTTVLYLKDLEVSQARSLLAIERVATNVSTLAKHSFELGDVLMELEGEVGAFKLQVDECRRDLQRVDMEQSATRDVTGIFDHWDAGHWAQCSALERIFLALDALYWGPFGDCIRAARRSTADQYLKIARDKAAARLRNELERDVMRPVPLQSWCEVGSRHRFFADAVGYLAETDNTRQPLCQMISTPGISGPRIPRILSIDRAIERVVDEVFVRRAIV